MSAPTPRTTPSTPLQMKLTPLERLLRGEIVTHRGKAFARSTDIAKHFNKRHNNVMRDIQKLECSERFSLLNFEQSDFIDDRGKKRRMYEMTRDGFTLLAMGLTGKEATRWKVAYIETFNRMERMLRKMLRADEKLYSEDRKMIRRITTDTIAEFVTYAKAQGSHHAHWYYKIFTDLINAIASPDALGPLFMSAEEHNRQSAAHICCMEAINSGMADGLEYKAIYAVAKDHLLAYADRHGWAVAKLGCGFDDIDAIEAEVIH